MAKKTFLGKMYLFVLRDISQCLAKSRKTKNIFLIRCQPLAVKLDIFVDKPKVTTLAL